jgi:ubiquinone/menaquinone biosynthesis C-methylase UbiE
VRWLKMTKLPGIKMNKSEVLPVNTVTTDQATIEQARDYEKRRFTRRPRMRKLDRYEKAFAQHLLDMVGGDSHILDVPCGNGRFYDIFADARKLTMADYSENMLAAARERIKNTKNVEFVRADISSLPLPDNCAELCFCMRLFHHMKDDQIKLTAFKELSRISNKYVAMSFYNKGCLRFYRRKLLGKKIRGNYVTFAHVVELASQAGLKFVKRIPRVNTIEQQSLVIFEKA